jgi:hypothetical protein
VFEDSRRNGKILADFNSSFVHLTPMFDNLEFPLISRSFNFKARMRKMWILLITRFLSNGCYWTSS